MKCGVCGGPIVHVKRITRKYGKEYLYELYACKNQHVRKKIEIIIVHSDI
ncbi:hypothetical protein P7H19_00080 [Paenibacillus larvae]|nr:hypothetical protein [Paenibacillus larvae]MDT2235099.1 hypothetical protein [Paenibacillus larvae]